MVTIPNTPKTTGGRLCLDFCNSMDGDRNTDCVDKLDCYNTLLRWCEHHELLSRPETEKLSEVSQQRPEEALRTLRRSVRLREAIYDLFRPDRRQGDDLSKSLKILNTELARGLCCARLQQEGPTITWAWEPAGSRLDAMLGPIARSAADLLTAPERHLVRECGGDRCTWLFFDTTKNHRRRWCDMKTCGNKAKVREYRRRCRP